MRTPAPALLLLPALLTAFLGGCASAEKGAMKTAERGATQAMETYMSALKRGDCAAAYACLSWKRRREISLEAIEADYAAHRDRYHYRADAKIEHLQYDDPRVFIHLVNGDGTREFVALLPEDGAWKIEMTSQRGYQDLIELIKHQGDGKGP